MSWQEQLRRIDAALAAGKLSKEQYAAKREELLAEASSTPSPSRASDEVDVPVQPQSRVSAHALLTTDRPTTAPSPADERSTDSMPHPAAQRRAAPLPPIAARELPPPVPVHAITGVPPSPSEPRSVEPPTPARPDVPDARRRGALSTWLFLTAGIILALALIGGGLWWLTTDSEDERTGLEPPATSSPTTTAPPTDLVDRLPELPGVFNLDSGTYSVSEGLRRELFGGGEAAVFRDNRVQAITWKGSYRAAQNGSTGFVVMVARHPSPRTAESTAKALRRIGIHNAKRVKFLDVDNVSTYRQETRSLTVYFAVYRSDRHTVHVSVGRTGDGEERFLRAEIHDLVESVTAVLPPS